VVIIQDGAGKRAILKTCFLGTGVVGGIASPDILLSTSCHLVTMEQWSGAQRAFTVKAFYKNNDSLKAARRLFHVHFNLQRHVPVPSAHVIKTWVRNFEETGSALKKKPPGGIRSARTLENITAVRTALIRSPKRSARRHALSLNLSNRSVRRIVHQDLNFHPYKVQVVQELKPHDLLTRKIFCQEMLTQMDHDEDFIHNLWMSDEARFHPDGFVNKQNFHYWSEENPRQLHQQPLHSDRVTVWRAISSHDIIGQYFFEDDNGRVTTVTSGRYANMIANFLTDELATGFPQVNEVSWFQQDGATSHTARVSLDAVRLLFHNHIISRNGDIP
jgi:transposase